MAAKDVHSTKRITPRAERRARGVPKAIKTGWPKGCPAFAVEQISYNLTHAAGWVKSLPASPPPPLGHGQPQIGYAWSAIRGCIRDPRSLRRSGPASPWHTRPGELRRGRNARGELVVSCLCRSAERPTAPAGGLVAQYSTRDRLAMWARVIAAVSGKRGGRRSEADGSRQEPDTRRVHSDSSRLEADRRRIVADCRCLAADWSRQTSDSRRFRADFGRLLPDSSRSRADRGRYRADCSRIAADRGRLVTDSRRPLPDSSRR